jgi:hypothetical protein
MNAEQQHGSKTITIAERFTKAVQELPQAARSKAWQVIDLLLTNPEDPALELKPIEDAARPDVYECRIDDTHRLILLKSEDGGYTLIAAGPYAAEGDRLLNRQEITEYITSEEVAFLYGGGELPFTDMTLEKLADMCEAEE